MAKITFICTICQNPFQRYPSQSHVYCSYLCSHIAKRKSSSHCLVCQKEFVAKGPKQVTCSGHCNKLNFYKTVRERAGGDDKYYEQQFWAKVKKTGPNDCWEWQGNIDRHGYGRFNFKGKTVLAHRFGYMLKHGFIPQTILVCHKCDNRLCCNENHHFPGTIADNHADRDAKGRQARGEKSGAVKLTKDQVLEIRDLYKTGTYSCKNLASIYNVIPCHINRIVRGVVWKHLFQSP